MSDVSPFLHREVSREARHQIEIHHDVRRARLAMDRERGRLTLERLRYRAYQRAGTLSSFMCKLVKWADPRGALRNWPWRWM
jgi:hypothetical protein